MKKAAVLAAVLMGAALTVAPLPAVAADPVIVHTSDFDDGTTQGWFARGPSAVAPSTVVARSGGHSLLSSARDATWQGPGRNMLGVLQKGAQYAVDAYVRLVAGTPAVAVHMTVQRTPDGGSTVFERVASSTVGDADWVLLRGEYTYPVDSTELQLYLESASATASFYVDDVVVTQIAPPPGGPPDEAGIASDFETGTRQGWAPRIGGEILTPTTADAHSGQYSLLTTGRNAAFYGPATNVLGKVTLGKKYDFSVWVKLGPGEAPADVRLSIERRSGGTPTFATIGARAGVTAEAWVQITGSYTLAVEVDFLTVYLETASGTQPFYMDDFQMVFVRPLPIETGIPSLKDVIGDDFKIGTAMNPSTTLGVHGELVRKHFNSMTAGNAMKWDATEPTEGNFTFGDADIVAAFAAAHGIGLRGHTLVWHSQVPAWVFLRPDGTPLTSGAEDKALLLRRVENHIRAVAGRYAGQIYAWDVVNEVVDESQPDGLRRSRFFEIAGLDYLRTAFRVAREVAPQAKLYLNDYNTEYPRKRDAVHALVSRLRAEGVPVDGIGHQLHVNVERQRIAEIEKSIELFAALGVEQQVTELDISVYTNFVESFTSVPAGTLALQGYRYRDLFDLFRRHKHQINSVTVWGVADDGTWLKSFPFPRLDLPLLFDEQLQSKPAYWGIADPSRLPQLNRGLVVPNGRASVDGQRELEWDLVPGTDMHSRNGLSATFAVRWDAKYLYVQAEVVDGTNEATDAVDIFVDENNAKTPAYQADDARYTVRRDGTHGSGFVAATAPTAQGYRVEARIPLGVQGTTDRSIGFDVRLRDASRPGEPTSWNDNAHGQDADTSRWGTLTLVKAVSRVDVPRGTPVIDGIAEPAWARASQITTEVQVIGSGGASATARLLWDTGHLYVYVTVTDSARDESSPNTYEQDSIEIFVDTENSKNAGYNDEDGQYRISFTNRQTISGNFNAGAIADNLRSAARITPTGYVIEASIELDTIRPGVGTLIGVDLQVNDATAGVRTAARTWHDPTGLSYLDTSRWGVAILTGGGPGPSRSTRLPPMG